MFPLFLGGLNAAIGFFFVIVAAETPKLSATLACIVFAALNFMSAALFWGLGNV